MKPILFRPAQAGVLESADPRVAALQACWLRYFPEAPLCEMDFEDWVENAVRLQVADELAPNRVAIVRPGHCATYLDGTAVADGEEVVFLGSWFQPDDPGRQKGVFSHYAYPVAFRDEDKLATAYAASPVFQAAAGRAMQLCGVPDKPWDAVRVDLYEYLAGRYAAGVRDVFLKVNQAKYGITRCTLTSADPEVLRDTLFDAEDGFAWATVHLAGQENAFIAQDAIEMEYEYRVVVVNHRAVAGAGCVEAFTPLDNQATWDTQVEARRGEGIVVQRPDLADRYRKFAETYVAAQQAEQPGWGHYTLDLALSQDQVVAVELNPLRNYGLYALDFAAVLKAQLAA